MNFTKSELLARIDEAIAKRIKETDEFNKKAVIKLQIEREQWMTRMMPSFVEFANVILERQKDGEPISKADIPERVYRYGDWKVWHEDSFVRQPDTASLEMLKTVLSASPYEKITSTGLRELGFRDLTVLF